MAMRPVWRHPRVIICKQPKRRVFRDRIESIANSKETVESTPNPSVTVGLTFNEEKTNVQQDHRGPVDQIPSGKHPRHWIRERNPCRSVSHAEVT